MAGFLDMLNHIAGSLGYARPLPRLISLSPAGTTLEINGSVDRGTYLGGDIRIGRGASVKQGTNLFGDVTIGQNVKIGAESDVSGTVTVGRYTQLNGNNYAKGDVSIGQFCAIAPRTGFYAVNHETDSWAVQHKFQSDLGIEFPKDEQSVRIGSDVWCGMDVIILPGVEIGHGACIGAHSVVTRDIEPYEIVAGNPAEHIRWRFDEAKRQQFLETAWWDWEIEAIRDRADDLRGIAGRQSEVP
jgi:acetyltransferase-like isoleucine patch superfamily enzyme